MDACRRAHLERRGRPALRQAQKRPHAGHGRHRYAQACRARPPRTARIAHDEAGAPRTPQATRGRNRRRLASRGSARRGGFSKPLGSRPGNCSAAHHALKAVVRLALSARGLALGAISYNEPRSAPPQKAPRPKTPSTPKTSHARLSGRAALWRSGLPQYPLPPASRFSLKAACEEHSNRL